MKFYQQEKVERARKLRKKGYSFESIGQKLLVNEGAVRRWCLDIPCQNKAFLAAKINRNQIKKSNAKILEALVIDRDIAKVFASILYWAEGTKYPHSTAVSFSNSDPGMVATFIWLLRTGFSVDEKRFKIHLQLHSTHDKENIFSYWSKLLKIPKTQFWKPTITNPTKNMKRQGYRGTCTVRYHDYKVLLKLIGIYEKFVERCAELARQRTANASSR